MSMIKLVFIPFLLWCALGSASSVNQFFEAHDKTHNCNELVRLDGKALIANSYKELAKTGEEILKNPSLTEKEKAKLHVRLSSIYCYLGKYEKAKDHALEGKEIAKEASLQKLLARNTSLLSASYRGLAIEASTPEEMRTLFDLAKQTGEEALEIANQILDHPYLKAKVLSVVATAYSDDPQADTRKAIEYFQKALPFFEENSPDQHRTLIRIARAQLRLKEYNRAWKTLSPLFSRPLVKRIRIQLDIVCAEICMKENNMQQAMIYAKNALSRAEKMNLTADVKLLRGWLVEIEEKRSKKIT